MNTIEIGKYIKSKRIDLRLTQKDLAEKLKISFQAVSKWETGTTLPDTSLLLELSDILEVTVDQILNAGEFRKTMNKKINVEEISNAIKSIAKLKTVLGPNNGIYKSIMAGLNKDGDTNFEEMLQSEEKIEILIAKSVIQLIIDGYSISDEEINKHFTLEGIQGKIQKYSKKYSS